jgi:hypothetical protein
MRRSRLKVAIVVLAGAVAAAAPAGAATSTVRVGRAVYGRPIQPNFLGLALEYNTLVPWVGLGRQTGPYAAPIDPVFLQLLRNLDPGGSPLIRIGGLSTERAWWPVPGMAKPPGITYNLTPAWTAAAQALAQAARVRYMLGINLEANSTRLAALEASKLLAGIGRSSIASLQIGNESDLYTALDWYRRQGGHDLPWYAATGTPVFARGKGWSPAQYVAEVKQFLRVLPPGVPVSGPDISNPPWFSAFAPLIGHSAVNAFTSHAYGTNQCIPNPADPGYPSIANQLSFSASHRLLAGLRQFVGLAHRYGGTYRVDEMGATSCNGRAGVSNTVAAALWELDSLFALAAAGVDGVNLHTYPHNLNALFDITFHANSWSAAIYPLYYGALLFEQAAPAGARLLHLTGSGTGALRAWATLAPDHRIRLLLLNDAVRRPLTVRVQAPGSASASLERLSAPGGAGATSGLTLGGAAVNSSGVLPPPAPASIQLKAGSYTVTLPAASAALLTL